MAEAIPAIDRLIDLHRPVARRWSSEQPDLVMTRCEHCETLWPCETAMVGGWA